MEQIDRFDRPTIGAPAPEVFIPAFARGRRRNHNQLRRRASLASPEAIHALTLPLDVSLGADQRRYVNRSLTLIGWPPFRERIPGSRVR